MKYKSSIYNLFAAKATKLLLPLPFCAFACATPALGSVVTNLRDDDSPGSLRAVIAAAPSGDTITFSVGGTITLIHGELAIDKNLTIDGGRQLFLDGNVQTRFFNIGSVTRNIDVTIAGVTMANGQVTGSDVQGGAILNNSTGTVTLTDCIFHHNLAVGQDGTDQTSFGSQGGAGGNAKGGAIYQPSAGTLILTNCVIDHNQAIGGRGGQSGIVSSGANGGKGSGGAIYQSAGVLQIINSMLLDNLAQGGRGGDVTANCSGLTPTSGNGGSADSGAIFCGGHLEISGSKLFRNTATAGFTGGRLGSCSLFQSGNDGTSHGGGLISTGSGGTLQILDSQIENNSAVVGGGILASIVEGTLSNSVVSGNISLVRNSDTISKGSAIYAVGSTLTVIDCTIADNQAGGLNFETHGSVVNLEGTMRLIGSTISGNVIEGVRAFGGGIYNDGGQLTVTNCTISGNQVTGWVYASGGGIFNVALSDSSSVELVFSTISSNALVAGVPNASPPNNANNYGAGIANNHPVANFTPTLNARNTIIARNLLLTANPDGSTSPGSPGYAPGIGPDVGGESGQIFSVGNIGVLNYIPGIFNSQGYNLIGDGSGATITSVTGDQIGIAGSPIDPLLGPLADNGGPTKTHALLAGSPAMDAGACDPNVTTDQRGQPRPQGTGCDVGAYESPLSATPANTAPHVVCPADATFDCAPAAGAGANLSASVTDPDSGQTLTVVLKQDALVLDTQTVASPATNQLVSFVTLTFSPGVHALTIEVSDGSASASCQTLITVNADTAAPVPDVAILPVITEECSASLTTVPTATDACVGRVIGKTSDPLVYNTPGTFSVHWVFDDGHGNTATQTQTVVVADTVPPVIMACPPDQTVPATSPLGAVVDYPSASADDNCSAPTISYSQDSGTQFGVGDTIVTVTATDAANNQAICSFRVHVSNASEQTRDLVAYLARLPIHTGIKVGLLAKLIVVDVALHRRQPQIQVACAALQHFINEAHAQRGKKLTTTEADQLITAAATIREAIGCN